MELFTSFINNTVQSIIIKSKTFRDILILKTKTEFILPLANQVIEILKEVQQFTGTGKYVFPSFTKKDKPMSDNTLIGALRRICTP